MTYLLSDEQKALQELLRDFFSRELPSERLRKRVELGGAHDAELWRALIDLQIFSLFESPENFTELYLIAYECGRSLCPEPLVSSLYFGAYLPRCLTDKSRGGSLPADLSSLGKGEAVMVASAFSHREALKSLKGGSQIPYVEAAREADFMALPNAKGVAFALRSDVTLKQESSLDLLTQSFSVELQKKPQAILPVNADEVGEQLMILHAAVLAGISDRAIELTKNYVTTREQFGVPVGGFQAVQHQLATAQVNSEAMSALAMFAAGTASARNLQRPLAARAALSFAAKHSVPIVETALQLHGGVGFTWEYELHLYLRRAVRIVALFEESAQDKEDLLALVGRPAT